MPKNVADCAKKPEQRAELGRLIYDLITAGIQQKQGCETWWDECERIHRNEWSEADSPGEGLVPMQVPFAQPRQDMLTAQVCSVLTRQDPYMLADDSGDDVSENLKEQVLHKFWKAAGFEAKMRRASNICTDTNRVWYRIAWEKTGSKPFGGLIFDVLHPRHVCLFPATVEGIPGARLIGHRFYRRLRELEAMQKAGGYFNDGSPLVGGDTPQEYDEGGEITVSGANPTVMGPDPKDERVELWDVNLRYDDGKGEKWYRATIAYKTATLLSFETFPYSRPWYFDASYIVTNDDAYWASVSVARHLSGLQDAVNKYNAALFNGGMMSAFPPIFGPELDSKDFRYTYGDYIPSDEAAKNWSPTVNFHGEPIMEHLQVLDMAGDRTARISANTQGSQQSHDATATESSIIAADVSVGIEEYIANFGGALSDLADFTMELLCLHFNEWTTEAAVLKVNLLQLAAPCLWEPNGKTPGNTPGAKLAAAEKLQALAAQFGPMTGIDVYELTRVVIANCGLFGSDNIQIAKDKIQPPAPPVGGGNAVPPGVLPPPGMANPQPFPPAQAGNGPAPMPAVGPGR